MMESNPVSILPKNVQERIDKLLIYGIYKREHQKKFNLVLKEYQDHIKVSEFGPNVTVTIIKYCSKCSSNYNFNYPHFHSAIYNYRDLSYEEWKNPIIHSDGINSIHCNIRKNLKFNWIPNNYYFNPNFKRKN